MAERLDNEDLCQYAYAFRESNFTSRIIVFVDGEYFCESFEWTFSRYGPINFKCLMQTTDGRTPNETFVKMTLSVNWCVWIEVQYTSSVQEEKPHSINSRLDLF